MGRIFGTYQTVAPKNDQEPVNLNFQKDNLVKENGTSESMIVSYEMAKDIIQVALDNIGVLIEEKDAMEKAPAVALKQSLKMMQADVGMKHMQNDWKTMT